MKLKILILFGFLLHCAVNEDCCALKTLKYFEQNHESSSLKTTDDKTNQETTSIQSELTEEEDAKQCCIPIAPLSFTHCFTIIYFDGKFISNYFQNILQPPCIKIV